MTIRRPPVDELLFPNPGLWKVADHSFGTSHLPVQHQRFLATAVHECGTSSEENTARAYPRRAGGRALSTGEVRREI